ncbi:AraC family transcriptional regulator [Streptomyces albiflavescens]|uniref:AraC family transcriptional regulator n=1 Tax=Streptomyces albiflavescens TaxID=1623582 RepID=A0A917YEH4_9ACTN|nr:AraC family transcriptional regulator [Streptomyces albiflavescens]
MPGRQLTAVPNEFTCSVEAGAPEERWAAWQETYSRACIDVEISPNDPASWRGALHGRRFGSLQITIEESSGPATILRSTPSAAADRSSQVFLRQQLEGSTLLMQDGRTAALGPGGSAFYDAARPFKLRLTGGQRARTLMMPRFLLRLKEAQLRLLTATLLDNAPATPNPLQSLVAGLAEETLAAAPDRREQLARATADMIAVLALHTLGDRDTCEQRPAVALLARIKGFIETRLGDPDLSPKDIADEHSISLRYVHQLFQQQDTTVNTFVRGRRLARAREDLARPDAARRTVAAVAARCGFASAAHFSRVFREAYGMSPVQWRTASRTGETSSGDAVH